MIKGNCIGLVLYADVFWDLKIYVFEALARAYKLQFCCGTFGRLPPPPLLPQYQKAGYATAHPYRSDYLFFLLLICLLVSLFRRKKRTLFRWGFFFLAGGGGACQLKILVPPTKPQGPPPPCPPTEKILATQLLGRSRIFIWGPGGKKLCASGPLRSAKPDKSTVNKIYKGGTPPHLRPRLSDPPLPQPYTKLLSSASSIKNENERGKERCYKRDSVCF